MRKYSIYGFTKAPISATISVTNADGESQEIATEVMTERNGWIHLGAYNFHFSAPTVRVKFTQEKGKVATSPIQKSITCQKGKITKKVSGGKCPPTFKKVS